MNAINLQISVSAFESLSALASRLNWPLSRVVALLLGVRSTIMAGCPSGSPEGIACQRLAVRVPEPEFRRLEDLCRAYVATGRRARRTTIEHLAGAHDYRTELGLHNLGALMGPHWMRMHGLSGT